MGIDRHTQTLALELRSGNTYKMSGDAGSSSWSLDDGDEESERVMSEANVAFDGQIENVRALILDAKGVGVGESVPEL